MAEDPLRSPTDSARRAFAFHWRAAGRAEATLGNYLSWLRRLDVDDTTTDDDIAAQLADLTQPQRAYAVRAVKAWGRWRGSALGSTLKTPRQELRPQPIADVEVIKRALCSISAVSAEMERDVRARAELAVLWATGMRVGELLRLRWGDVDLHVGTAVIERAKSGRGRVVGLDATACAWLRAWREMVGDGGGSIGNRRGMEGDETRFIPPDPPRVFGVSKSTVERDLMALAGIRPHEVRRAFALAWLRASGSETSLRSLCGWRSNAMVAHYVGMLASETALLEYRKVRAS